MGEHRGEDTADETPLYDIEQRTLNEIQRNVHRTRAMLLNELARIKAKLNQPRPVYCQWKRHGKVRQGWLLGLSDEEGIVVNGKGDVVGVSFNRLYVPNLPPLPEPVPMDIEKDQEAAT